MAKSKRSAKKPKVEVSDDRKPAKDSFDRFGDDLTELLISFLPIGHKFRFECVCRQWQRLIFNRQHKLVLDYHKEIDRNTIKTPMNKEYHTSLFGNLFRKLKFLRDIENHHWFTTKHVESIINDCQYIERFGFHGPMNVDLFNQLTQKFGQRLVDLDISQYFTQKWDNVFKHTPNLKRLKINKNLNYLNEAFLPKLVDIYLPKNVDSSIFSTFTDKYCNQIQSIVIRFDNDSSPDQIKRCLTLISKYPNLESLKVKFNMNCKSSSAHDSELKLIGIKCKSLKRLAIRSLNWLTNDSLLSVINHFSSVVRLSLIIDNYSQQVLGTMAELNNCSHLKNFKLEIDGLKDETFKDIHLFLPNLISFESNDCVRNQLTDEALRRLSRLQCLRYLSLIGKEFTESGALELINVCPQIQVIDINFRPTQRSVDAMSEVARRRAKYHFKLFVNSWPNKPLFEYEKNNIPINLSIIQL